LATKDAHSGERDANGLVYGCVPESKDMCILVVEWGRNWGIDWKVFGIVDAELSQDDESSLSGGDLRPAGNRAMDSLKVADPL
jgi:hypothetical protein